MTLIIAAYLLDATSVTTSSSYTIVSCRTRTYQVCVFQRRYPWGPHCNSLPCQLRFRANYKAVN